MKTKKVVIALFALVTLISCLPAVKTAPHADNFAFVFKDYSCAPIPLNVLDTTSGTLVHTPLDDTTSITISLHLTDDELETIYQKAISVGFFNYPSKFVVPDDQVLGYQTPPSNYELSMTNGEMINSVSWTDGTMTKSDYTKADKLRELVNLINKIIQSHPEIQQLPQTKAACA